MMNFNLKITLIALILASSITALAKHVSHLGHMADDNVFHHEDCTSILKGGNLNADYDKIISFMRQNGLQHLLGPVDRGEVVVVLDPESSNAFDVKWAFGTLMSTKRVITIRNLTAFTERQYQARIWQLAIALYETAAAQRLFSQKSLIANTTIDEIRSHQLPWYKALPMLAGRLISDWSNSRVDLYTDLESDLYKLIDALPLIEPRRVLPEFDSRTHWVTDLVTLGSDLGDPRPIPNLEDLRQMNNNPNLNLNSIVRNLHRDSFSFNYFVKNLTRFIIFACAYDIGAAAYHLAPVVIEIPGVITSSAPAINTTAEHDDDVEKAFLQYEHQTTNSPVSADSAR